MTRELKTLSHDISLCLLVPGDDGLLLRATLRYDPSDPCAVAATFRAGDGSISWVLGRDLLSAGMRAEIGLGDVRVWPAGLTDWSADDGVDLIMVELRSTDGRATLAVEASDLAAFLDRTFAVVPQGEEADHMLIDDVIDRLLG